MIVMGSLLHRNKTELLSRVLRHAWAGYAWPEGHARTWVVADNDADDPAREAMQQAANGDPVQFVQADLSGLKVLAPDKMDHPRYMSFSNRDHLRKMARLRDAVRARAVEILNAEEPDPARRYLLWQDCDIEAPTQGLKWLLETFESTSGPLAPRLVSGIYNDRTSGQFIAQYWKGNPEAAKLFAAKVQPVGFIGMGFMLQRADTAEAQTWEDFEVNPSRYTVGEDVFYCWHVEKKFGPPCYLDGRVLCRHYQDNGFCWGWGLDERGELDPRPITDFQFEENKVPIYWTGRDGAVTDLWGKVHANQEFRVSPETARWLVDSGFCSREPLMVQL